MFHSNGFPFFNFLPDNPQGFIKISGSVPGRRSTLTRKQQKQRKNKNSQQRNSRKANR